MEVGPLFNELVVKFLFKTSKKDTIGKKIKDFIQLFVYASLYHKKTNKYLNALTIYNPLYATEYIIHPEPTDIDEILKILENYKIASKSRAP